MFENTSTLSKKKEKITELLKTNGFVDIFEKQINNRSISISNKYLNCKAIIIIVESPPEKEGAGG